MPSQRGFHVAELLLLAEKVGGVRAEGTLIREQAERATCWGALLGLSCRGGRTARELLATLRAQKWGQDPVAVRIAAVLEAGLVPPSVFVAGAFERPLSGVVLVALHCA